MGMPCEINSILKLNPSQGYPDSLEVGLSYQVQKSGYRLIPLDVPIPLVASDWYAYADVIIRRLVWENQSTMIDFVIARVYEAPISMH